MVGEVKIVDGGNREADGGDDYGMGEQGGKEGRTMVRKMGGEMRNKSLDWWCDWQELLKDLNLGQECYPGIVLVVVAGVVVVVIIVMAAVVVVGHKNRLWTMVRKMDKLSSRWD